MGATCYLLPAQVAVRPPAAACNSIEWELAGGGRGRAGEGTVGGSAGVFLLNRVGRGLGGPAEPCSLEATRVAHVDRVSSESIVVMNRAAVQGLALKNVNIVHHVCTTSASLRATFYACPVLTASQ